jgi:hypothetical protein
VRGFCSQHPPQILFMALFTSFMDRQIVFSTFDCGVVSLPPSSLNHVNQRKIYRHLRKIWVFTDCYQTTVLDESDQLSETSKWPVRSNMRYYHHLGSFYEDDCCFALKDFFMWSILCYTTGIYCTLILRLSTVLLYFFTGVKSVAKRNTNYNAS